MRRAAKIIRIILLAILALVILLLLFMQLKPFRNLLRKAIENEANKTLVNAELNIGEIEGNFWSSIGIKELSISQSGKPLANIENISLKYSLSGIFVKKIIIKEILIAGWELDLRQDEEGVWNLQKLLPAAYETRKEKKDIKAKESAWRIELDSFILKDVAANIYVSAETTSFPAGIFDLNMTLSGGYASDKSWLELKSFRFKTRNPELSLENISFKADWQDEEITMHNLTLQTAENLLTASGKVNIKDVQQAVLKLRSSQLNLEEFAGFLPDLPLKHLPAADLDILLENSTAEIDIRIAEGRQALHLAGGADSLFTKPSCSLILKGDHLDGGYWLAGGEFDSDLNFVLKVQGSGIIPEEARLNVDLMLSESSMFGKEAGIFELKASKIGSSADLDFLLEGDYGRITLSGEINEIFADLDYDLKGSLNNLDLAEILEDEEMHTDLNLDFAIQGTGIDPETLKAELLLAGEPSRVKGISVDNLQLNILYQEEDFEIMELVLNSEAASLILSGGGNIYGDKSVRFSLVAGDLSTLEELISADRLSAAGEIKGEFSIINEDISTELDLNLTEINYNELFLGLIAGKISLVSENGIYGGDIVLDLQDAQSSGVVLNSVRLHSWGTQQMINNELQIRGGKIRADLTAGVQLDSVITVSLPYLKAGYDSLVVETADTNARFIINDGQFSVIDLQLLMGKAVVLAGGRLNPAGEQDFELEITGFELSELSRSGLVKGKMQGILNLHSKLQGSLKQPELIVDLQIDKAGWEEIAAGDFALSADLAESYLTSDFSLTHADIVRFTGTAAIPVYLDSTKSESVVPDDEALEVNLVMNDLDIGWLKKSLPGVRTLEGMLSMEFKLRNTLAEPQITGIIDLAEGVLKIPEWGINYPEIRMQSEINQRELSLTEFYAKGEDGWLKLSGEALMHDNISQGLKNMQIYLKSDKFPALNKRGLQLFLTSDLNLKGTPDNLVYGGYLNIPKAVIDLRELPGASKRAVDMNSPLLVQAEQRQDTTGRQKPSGAESDKTPILDNLTGELNLQIPKNTWVRNNDMNIEISGNLRIVKKAKDFEIFGEVQILRGKYKLYGRKFDLQGGSVIFSGGTPLAPYLDLSIRHVFRDIERNKRTLLLVVTGQAEKPAIEFFLDDEKIPETDAVSYLLFGRSSSEINRGEKAEVAEQSETGFAMGLLAKQVGEEIADQIGKTLKLDVVEFSGGSSWKQASILVGKYITNDLFINYKKEFALGQSSEIVPDEVSLEYEINKNFYLQATRGNEKSTGLDLYWKFKLK